MPHELPFLITGITRLAAFKARAGADTVHVASLTSQIRSAADAM
jgi:hypothetical protein